jgi:hypothetical protein
LHKASAATAAIVHVPTIQLQMSAAEDAIVELFNTADWRTLLEE